MTATSLAPVCHARESSAIRGLMSHGRAGEPTVLKSALSHPTVPASHDLGGRTVVSLWRQGRNSRRMCKLGSPCSTHAAHAETFPQSRSRRQQPRAEVLAVVRPLPGGGDHRQLLDVLARDRQGGARAEPDHGQAAGRSGAAHHSLEQCGGSGCDAELEEFRDEPHPRPDRSKVQMAVHRPSGRPREPQRPEPSSSTTNSNGAARRLSPQPPQGGEDEEKDRLVERR